MGNLITDGLHDAGGLVTQQERVVVVDAALAVGEVGVAYAAGKDAHHHIAGTWIGDRDRLDRGRGPFSCRDHTTHLLCHDCLSLH